MRRRASIRQAYERALALIRAEYPDADAVAIWAGLTRKERREWMQRASESR